MRYLTRSRIIGCGMTRPATKTGLLATDLMNQALQSALASAGVRLRQLDGLVAVPSLSEPHFMEAHYLATRVALLPSKGVVVRTIDTGGAGPITGLLEADRMIRSEGLDLVAVVAGDAVSSLPSDVFLERADAGCRNPDGSSKSPVIPHGYDRIAQWQISTGSVTRPQLAMASVLMSRQAARHPLALTRKGLTLQQVLDAQPVGEVTGLLECARRADGGAAIIVASSRFMKENGIPMTKGPVVLSGGEASGPLYPPSVIDEEMFSCEEAVQRAFEASQLGISDIDFFGLYDCFPICFVRAVEAVGLAPKGGGGAYVEEMYRLSEAGGGKPLPPDVFPVNTHGGLLSFGAPWETPAMYNIIEAVEQLNGTANDRQVKGAKRALVYGNGGIFSASSVCILGKGTYS